MRIVYLIPGSGGSFYCENCVRDYNIVSALKKKGVEIITAPLYLPPGPGKDYNTNDLPIFYGAINTYLKQYVPIFRKIPSWLERLLDSPFLLKWAAQKAGSTRASGLEELTLSMLKGDRDFQSRELEKLQKWLKQEIKPDLIHLSNLLLSGIGKLIKQNLGIPVVCTLQDEDTWINIMRQDYKEAAWEIMSQNARQIDALIPVSKYFTQFMETQLNISKEKFHVIPLGIDPKNYSIKSGGYNNPVIGFLSREAEFSGLDLLVEAFIRLKQGETFNNLKLYIMGGMTKDDKKYIQAIKRRLIKTGLKHYVRFFADFSLPSRVTFLKECTVVSVPLKRAEAFGLFQLEALATGVPVVQPREGGFTKIIEQTGGGLLYEPNEVTTLTQTLKELLLNPQLIKELGKKGHQAVIKKFTLSEMALKIVKLYKKIIKY